MSEGIPSVHYTCGCGMNILVSASSVHEANDCVLRNGWILTPNEYPPVACSIRCWVAAAVHWERERSARHAVHRRMQMERSN